MGSLSGSVEQSSASSAGDKKVAEGDYRIIDVLGQGGFGLTYKGFDTRLNSLVAIKEYFPADMAIREDSSSVRVRSRQAIHTQTAKKAK